ncbi:MAG: pyridoxal phosphate-dependent aminotransferase [Rhizobiales bacterium]|nr:pyridoxal phosphate-dependent aminotransferase [Hyphomicrobiales bacterium]
MSFDFDRVIDRRNTHSMKWDALQEKLGLSGPDLLPMWVADMDFRAPPAVAETMRKLADHGVFGYFGDSKQYKSSICNWMKTRHDFDVDPDWILTTHGIVAGIGFAIKAYSEPGDGVVVFSPVYHMFGNTIRASGRKLIESPLRQVQGRYEMDLENLASQIDSSTKLVLLCSPHNPGGRVWSAQELKALGQFCSDHNLILVSDEIHHDLVYAGHKHTVTANACPDITDRLVTMTATTKTFNIAGILTGNVIISNAELRKKYIAAVNALGSGAPNGIGVQLATAAYSEGADWLDALLPYLQSNRDLLNDAVAKHMPGVRSMKLEATYLSWYDFSGTGMSPQEAVDLVQKKARIAINQGGSFGEGGEGWLRFNIACPRATLEEAIDRLKTAFAER